MPRVTGRTGEVLYNKRGAINGTSVVRYLPDGPDGAGLYVDGVISATGAITTDTGDLGGGSITGTDTQVLFFDGADTPAGDAGLTYDKTTGALSFAANIPVGAAPITIAGGDDDDDDSALVFDCADNYIALVFKRSMDILPEHGMGIYGDTVNFEQHVNINTIGFAFDANVSISGYPSPLVVQTQNDSAASPVAIRATATTQHSVGTVDSLTGVRIGTATSDNGVTTAVYGVYIEDQTVGGTANYAIKTGLGTVDLGDTLTVAGNVTVNDSYIVVGTSGVRQLKLSANDISGDSYIQITDLTSKIKMSHLGGISLLGSAGGAIELHTNDALATATFNDSGTVSLFSVNWTISLLGEARFASITPDDGGGLRSLPVPTFTALLQAYDWDDTIYRTFGTLTSGNTPDFTIAPPAGGTVTLQASTFKSSDGTSGTSAGPFTTITAITVMNGLVTSLTGS